MPCHEVAEAQCVWQPNLAHFGSLFWPTLRVDGLRSGLFFLIYLYKESITKAVGMWESRWFCGISKGGGKGGKPWFGFPCFPRTGISTALSFHGFRFLAETVASFALALAFRLLILLGVL